MAKPKPAKWTCNICGESGDAPTVRLARASYATHYGEAHNEVPWLTGQT